MSGMRYESPNEEEIRNAAEAAAEEFGEEYSQDKHNVKFTQRLLGVYNDQNGFELSSTDIPYPVSPVRFYSSDDFEVPVEQNDIENFYEQAEDGTAYILFTGLHEDFKPGQADVAEMHRRRVDKEYEMREALNDVERYFQEFEDELNDAAEIEEFDPIKLSVQEVPLRLEDAERYTKPVKVLDDAVEYLNIDLEKASLCYPDAAGNIPDLKKQLEGRKIEFGKGNGINMRMKYHDPDSQNTVDFGINILGEQMVEEHKPVIAIPRDSKHDNLNDAADWIKNQVDHLGLDIIRPERNDAHRDH